VDNNNGRHSQTGCYWAEQCVTLGCLACYVTDMAQRKRFSCLCT